MDFPVSRRFYRMVLLLFPTPFRKIYGGEMEVAFLASIRRAGQKSGRRGFLGVWFFILADSVWQGLRQRASMLRRRRQGSNRKPRGQRPFFRSMREDGRSAARHLARNPGFTFAVVGTLALGIGLNTVVFGGVYSLLLRPLPGVTEPEELSLICRSRGMGAEFLPSSLPLFQDLASTADPFSGVSGWTYSELSVGTGDRAERVLGQIVSSRFFEVLGVPMVLGRGFSSQGPELGPQEQLVVVSEGFWRNQLGGDPRVIGRTLDINGSKWEIIGVAAGEFRGLMPILAPALWAPLSHHPKLMRSDDLSQYRENHFLDLVARLKPGLEPGAAQEWLREFAARLAEEYPEAHKGIGLSLIPQKRAGLHPAVRDTQVGLSGVLIVVVALLLLMASVNVSGLFLAKAQSRRKELALRRGLGASPARLRNLLLMESAFLALAAGGVGVLIARYGLAGLNRIRLPIQWTLNWSFSLDWPTLVFTSCLTLLAGLVFGLAPSVRIQRLDLMTTLKGGASSRLGKGFWKGRLLVFVQVALSTVLLVLSGLFAKNLKSALEIDTGFRSDGLFLATLDPGLQGFSPSETEELFVSLSQRIENLPGVRSVGMARYVPLGIDGAQRLVEVPGYLPSPEESMNVRYNIVNSGYFSSMGIPVTSGRGFQAADEDPGSVAAIVNQCFVERFWPNESAVGKTFSEGGREWNIVGVVPDGKYVSLGETIRPFIYFPWGSIPSGAMTLHVFSNSDPTSLIALVRNETEALAPGMPLYDLKTMEEHLAFSLLPARLGAVTVGLFGLVCVLLLCVGVHGVVGFSVAQRIPEVGVRIALGAGVVRATTQIVFSESKAAGGGLLLGFAVALGLSQLVKSLLYFRNTLDPVVFAGSVFLVAAVANLSAFFPARLAARSDPSEVLRRE